MENNKNNNPRTAEIKLPSGYKQNEKKMPTYHHPTDPPKPKE